jgi:hypothetical protein
MKDFSHKLLRVNVIILQFSLVCILIINVTLHVLFIIIFPIIRRFKQIYDINL